MKRYILFILIAFCTVGYAQKEKTAKQYKKEAEKLVDQGDLYTAVDRYKEACKLEPEEMSYAYRLGELLLMTRDFNAALEEFEKVAEKDPYAFPKAQYFYAVCLIRAGNYDQAVEQLKVFKKKYKGDDKSDYRKKVKNDLKSCEQAKAMIAKPKETKINHMGDINRAYTESGPIPLGDTAMIFSSMPYDSMYWIDPQNENEVPFHAKLYTAALRNGEWVNTGEYQEGPYNEEGVFVGNGSFSRDGKRFYYSRCEEQEDGYIKCKIYESKLIGKEWQPGKPLNEEINHPDFTTTQPTMGWDPIKNRDVIYFVSDRDDLRGMGGLDIYYSVFDNRKTKDWKKPRNLKRNVNSVGDDMTPFYDMESGVLYFASDGWPGMGGLDIQMSKGAMKKWDKATNIGYPINTGADELYYVLNESGEGGFFTSNREGGTELHNPTCCDDLYSFENLNIIRILVKGKVVDKDDPNEKPVPNAVISLYISQDDGTDVLIRTDTTSRENLGYALKLQEGNRYKITAYKKGYFTGETTFSTIGFAKSDTVNLNDILIEKLPEKEEGITLKVLFDFNSSALNEDSKKSLDEALISKLRANPSLIVEVGAHTDNVGSELANRSLSQQRAQSIVEYCTSQGINPKRLISKGYGESDPVAPNTNADGSDNPEGRAKNRRVEFKVLSDVFVDDSDDDY